MVGEASAWLPGETLSFQIDRTKKPYPPNPEITRWVSQLSLVNPSLRDGWIHNLNRQTSVKASLIRAKVSAMGCDGGGIWPEGK